MFDNTYMKTLLLIVSVLFLSACAKSSDSTSGAQSKTLIGNFVSDCTADSSQFKKTGYVFAATTTYKTTTIYSDSTCSTQTSNTQTVPYDYKVTSQVGDNFIIEGNFGTATTYYEVHKRTDSGLWSLNATTSLADAQDKASKDFSTGSYTDRKEVK